MTSSILRSSETRVESSSTNRLTQAVARLVIIVCTRRKPFHFLALSFIPYITPTTKHQSLRNYTFAAPSHHHTAFCQAKPHQVIQGVTLARKTITNRVADFPTSVMASREVVAQNFKQLLEQCDPDAMPDMISQMNLKLAHHRRTLNSQRSPLTKLPPELILNIGEWVLGKGSLDRDKARFIKVLPFMQTCAQLQAQLLPLFAKTLTYEILVFEDQIWDDGIRELNKLERRGPLKGRVNFVVHISDFPVELEWSTAAAIAGALECAIYGTLTGKSTVYVECPYLESRADGPPAYYVSHDREAHMLERANEPGFPLKLLSPEEARSLWSIAREGEGD